MWLSGDLVYYYAALASPRVWAEEARWRMDLAPGPGAHVERAVLVLRNRRSPLLWPSSEANGLGRQTLPGLEPECSQSVA